jgi:hypothetical protein
VSTITIERQAGGQLDRARKYKVLIDGKKVGTIGKGKRVSFDVPRGSHEVMLKIDWARSEPLRVDLAENEEAELFCEPNANLLTVLYFVSFVRKKYIGLRRA